MENIVLPQIKTEILEEHEQINSFLEVNLETSSSPVFEASFIETDNKTLKYKCPMCTKKFKSKKKVQCHVNSHITIHSIYTNGDFKCSECNCYFDTKENFLLHIETHKKNRGRPRKDSLSSDDDVKPYICDKCAKGFKRKQQLLNHSLVHYDIKPFQCDQCDKSFKLKQQLQNHSKVHDDIRPFTCDDCEKSFKFKQQLENHSKTHTDIRPFKCLFCEKAFKFKQQLQNHCRVHDDLRPFKCDFCDKAFKLKQQLQFHNKVHSDERPFQCLTCEKSFKFKQQLKNHYKVHSKVFIESSILEPKINLETMDVSTSNSLQCDENEEFEAEQKIGNENSFMRNNGLYVDNSLENHDFKEQINNDLIPTDESTEKSIVGNGNLARDIDSEKIPLKKKQELLKNNLEKNISNSEEQIINKNLPLRIINDKLTEHKIVESAKFAMYIENECNSKKYINNDNIIPKDESNQQSSEHNNVENGKLAMEINLEKHSLKQ